MTKREHAVLWSSIAAIAVCVIVLAVVLGNYLRRDTPHSGTTQIVVDPPKPSGGEEIRGELDVRLVRERLDTVTLNNRGMPIDGRDDREVDFSDTADNVFGLKSNTLIGPGCRFAAHMKISNRKRGKFAYWVEIKPRESGNALTEQLECSFSAGETTVRQTLGDGFTTESAPIEVADDGVSSFTVTLTYLSTEDNDKTQGLSLQFDMIVHVRLV